MNNKESNIKSQICKIVYFDEESVTDYIQIIEGGKLDKTTQLLDVVNDEGSSGVDANISGGTKSLLKGLLGLEVKASVSSGLKTSFNTNKIAKNILKNTILTDFISIIDKNGMEDDNKPIKKFKEYELTVSKDSLTYMVLISPYLSMISNTDIPAGEFNIAIDRLDSTLKNAKGYYEFIGTSNTNKVIFRFNIDSFKNNYKVTDLLKMNVSIYAIKVGECSLSELNVNNEFEIQTNYTNIDNPDYEEKKEVDKERNQESKLEVFDVLLAGVEI